MTIDRSSYEIIANQATTYKTWKDENKLSAEIAIHLLNKAIREDKAINSLFIESASSVIHDKWLERNSEWADETQKLPYEKLSKEDKVRDRAIVEKAIVVAYDAIMYDHNPIGIRFQIDYLAPSES